MSLGQCGWRQWCKDKGGCCWWWLGGRVFSGRWLLRKDSYTDDDERRRKRMLGCLLCSANKDQKRLCCALHVEECKQSMTNHDGKKHAGETTPPQDAAKRTRRAKGLVEPVFQMRLIDGPCTTGRRRQSFFSRGSSGCIQHHYLCYTTGICAESRKGKTEHDEN